LFWFTYISGFIDCALYVFLVAQHPRKYVTPALQVMLLSGRKIISLPQMSRNGAFLGTYASLQMQIPSEIIRKELGVSNVLG
jgi:hypothetical protein